MEDKKLVGFGRLLEIMDELRLKCPWDKVQTNGTLRHLTIEEVYELSEAILSDDSDAICGELGDLLLHVVFYAKIGSENERFSIETVIEKLCEKLIRRHPHIYGTVEADNVEVVKQNWEQIKLKEGSGSVLKGVPAGLPAMIKAMRIQEKVASVGFDWEKAEDVLDKVAEEIGEVKVELQNQDSEKLTEEIGDMFFALINFARFVGVNAEDALEMTNKKFIKRFQFIEGKGLEMNKLINEMTVEEMNIYWEESKATSLHSH